ncbi:MAG: hypothetical protein IPL47_14935 [Phyllobacteriaceae bacterium]|nr:hypothetical protein [Phyllobacteriaceae bacterium]
MYWLTKIDKGVDPGIAGFNNPYGVADFFLEKERSELKNKKMEFQFVERNQNFDSLEDFIWNPEHPLLVVKEPFYLLSMMAFSHCFDVFHGNIGKNRLLLLFPVVEIKCFDYMNSKFERFKYAERDIDSITIFRILSDKLIGAPDFFRIGDEYALRFYLITSDRFKSYYEKSGFTGLVFKPAC